MFYLVFILVVGALLRVNDRRRIGLVFAVLLTFCVVAFRFEIAVDWWNYIDKFKLDGEMLAQGNLLVTELFRRLTMGSIEQLGLPYVVHNMFYAAFAVFGLFFFLAKLPHRHVVWLAIAPFFVVLLAMGYVRQSLAVGIVFFVAGSVTQYASRLALLGGVSAGYHLPSSLISLALNLWNIGRNWKWSFIGILFVCLLLALNIDGFLRRVDVYLSAFDLPPLALLLPFDSGDLFGSSSARAGPEPTGTGEIDATAPSFVPSALVSAGALYRVGLAAIGCTGVFLLRKGEIPNLKIAAAFPHRAVALATFALIPVALIFSTFADRYMYFALPSFALGICMIQQRVHQSLRWLSGTAIAGLYLGAFAGWMVFGTHADAWLPYQMYWFGGEILTFAW